MNLLLVDNAHIYKTIDGKYYTQSIYNSVFFKRYLDIFDNVYFLAKTKHIDSLNDSSLISMNIDRLHIIELPWYQGIKEMCSVLFPLIRVYRNANRNCDVTIFRVCQIESFLSFILRRVRSKYYLEVVNDPETFIGLPKLFYYINIAMLMVMIKRSSGASFVTERVLQEKYLSKKVAQRLDFLQSHYSSVEILRENILQPRHYTKKLSSVRLIHVANHINDDTKGHYAVLKILSLVRAHGIDATAVFIGDGSYVDELKKIAIDFNITHFVDFVGRFSDREVLFRKFLDADIFIYPTKLEGLPRSLIEAMASGLPCLSTPIAGIPELLDKEYLFEPNDIQGFCKKIIWLIENGNELNMMSKKNVAVASRFENSILNQRRSEFYHAIVQQNRIN